MKRTIFLSLIIALIIGSCTQEKKSPNEGVWNLVYGDWPTMSVTASQTYPAQITGGQIKIYTKNYFSHTGELKIDTTVMSTSGCGSYTLEGNKFEETILYRKGQTGLGIKIKLLLDVRNDSLILRWPVDENWKLAEKYNTEKYIRLK
jgi:hypothetical protein